MTLLKQNPEGPSVGRSLRQSLASYLDLVHYDRDTRAALVRIKLCPEGVLCMGEALQLVLKDFFHHHQM